MYKIYVYSIVCMVLYRVLAALKLWELLRSDKDGLVDESQTTSNDTRNENEPLKLSNSDSTQPDKGPQNAPTMPTNGGSADEVAIDLIDQALDGNAGAFTTGDVALDWDNEEEHKEAGAIIDMARTNTLGILPKHQHLASASGEISIDMSNPGDLTPQTSAAKMAAQEATQAVSKKATAWWKKAWHYLNRPGYKGAGRRVFWQLLDLELFHILYVNIVVGMTGSSAPQRMLKVYEAVFEAAPQVWSLNMFPFPFSL